MALQYTAGFLPSMLLTHFGKHVLLYHEFPYATADEYETNADRFMGGPLDADTLECFRTKADGTVGDRLRYNRVTQEFGILGNDNVIRTYYIPDPVSPPPRGHTKGTNLQYFYDACNEVRG